MRPVARLFSLAAAVMLWAIGIPAGAQDSAAKLAAEADYRTAQRASAGATPGEAALSNDILQKADQLTHDFAMHREDNKVYELIIVSILALIALFMVLRFLTARMPDSGAHVVSATGLICIIFGTIIVGIMAQTDQQMTAAVGILGAVAGYLFRSMQRGEAAGSDQQAPLP